MADVPFYVWVQIGSYVLTLLGAVASAVWFFSKMKNDFDKGLIKVGGRIDLLNQSVQPYGTKIDELSDCQSELKQKVTELTAQVEGTQRDTIRIEKRLDETLALKR